MSPTTRGPPHACRPCPVDVTTGCFCPADSLSSRQTGWGTGPPCPRCWGQSTDPLTVELAWRVATQRQGQRERLSTPRAGTSTRTEPAIRGLGLGGGGVQAGISVSKVHSHTALETTCVTCGKHVFLDESCSKWGENFTR